MGLRSGLLPYVIGQLPMSQTLAESTPAEDVMDAANSASPSRETARLE